MPNLKITTMSFPNTIKIGAAAIAIFIAALWQFIPGPDQQHVTARTTANAGFAVGDKLNPERIHMIDRPGLYGLGEGLPGSSYAISDNHLIRVDATNFRVQSILRSRQQILD